MDKRLEDKHIAARRSTRTFCERELRPIAADIDQAAPVALGDAGNDQRGAAGKVR